MLFNLHNDGSRELQELTGLFYANNSFATIAPEIRTATDTVASLVGEDIIKTAEDRYESLSPDMDFINVVRMPIACLAIMNWSKQNLVSHEDSGRKMKLNDNDKVPFEWMIDRDDRELREKYYRAMDALYAYMAKDPDKWGITAFETESVVRNVNDLERIFPIEQSSYCFHLLLPLFIEVQRTTIKKLIGVEGFETIKTDPDGEFAYHVRRLVVLKALAVAVRRWSLTVFPLMVARRFAPSYQGNNEHSLATLKEIDWYVQGLQADAAAAQTELQELMSGGANGWKEVRLLPENDKRKKFFNVG